jgi:Na+-transporting methylmalonyl-CoA/oxaloacetate decarboxylase gamma subunit
MSKEKEIDIFELAKARLSRVEEYEKKLNEEKVALAQIIALSQNPQFQQLNSQVVALVRKISELEQQKSQIEQEIKNAKDQLAVLQLQQTKLLSVIKKAIAPDGKQ